MSAKYPVICCTYDCQQGKNCPLNRTPPIPKATGDEMTTTNSPACPSCGKPLQKVTRDPDSMFNAEQFDAVRAGDWFCEACPDNGRARTGYRYFWDSDLAPKLPATQQATTEPHPLVEDVRVAMRKAFNFGQTHWRQSDSESVVLNRASDETSRKFSKLVTDTCDALAAGIAQPAAPSEAHPLDGLHINKGSMDAAADAYEREYQKAKCRDAYDNRYHKVKAECPYDEWEACWFKALAGVGQAPESRAAPGDAAPLPKQTGPSARNSTLDEIALWYADKGWLLDEGDVPAAIRALAASPSPAPAQPTANLADALDRIALLHENNPEASLDDKASLLAHACTIARVTLALVTAPTTTLTQPRDRALWTDEQRENHRKNLALVYRCTICCAKAGEPHLPSCSEQGICGA